MRRRLLLAFLTVALGGAASRAEAQTPRVFLVFFEQWSAQIGPAADDVVASALGYAKANPALRIEVLGFADPTGSTQANLFLSLLRAQRVSDLLVDGGIAAQRIRRSGEGAVSYLGTPQESRRVEILVGAP